MQLKSNEGQIYHDGEISRAVLQIYSGGVTIAQCLIKKCRPHVRMRLVRSAHLVQACAWACARKGASTIVIFGAVNPWHAGCYRANEPKAVGLSA